jgi:N-acyl-D-amino-acid deacylase
MLRRQPLGINVASFVGHSQLREYVMGPAAWHRAANAGEREGIAHELGLALANGALGLSLSFFDRDRQGNAVPNQLDDDAETNALFAVLGERGGSVQFVSSDIHRLQDVARIGEFARRHGVVILHNTLFHKPDDPEHSASLIRLLSKLQADGVRALFNGDTSTLRILGEFQSKPILRRIAAVEYHGTSVRLREASLAHGSGVA